MRKLSVIVILALTILGCVATPTDESKAVRTIDHDSDYKCEYLGFVTGSGPMGWTTAHDAEGAMNDLRNKAAAMGANAVKIINVDSDMDATTALAQALTCTFD